MPQLVMAVRRYSRRTSMSSPSNTSSARRRASRRVRLQGEVPPIQIAVYSTHGVRVGGRGAGVGNPILKGPLSTVLNPGIVVKFPSSTFFVSIFRNLQDCNVFYKIVEVFFVEIRKLSMKFPDLAKFL